MRYRVVLTFLLAAGLLFLHGCGRAEEVSISPLPSGDRGSSELGPGVRPLSYGPGYKGSPNWSPDGERISFTVDGYVVDRPVRGGDIRRWTARDFGARDIESYTARSMLILGGGDEDPDAPGSLYRARPSGNSPAVTEVTPDVLTAEPAGDQTLLSALRSAPEESILATVRAEGVETTFGEVEGTVTGLSLSPDGRRVVLAVVPTGEEIASEIHMFDLTDGSVRRTARLEDDRQVFGAPQWTESGVYYVAGSEDGDGEEGAALYELFRIPEDSGRPEAAPGVGEDFAASSIQLSPDGTRLAIIGRLHANAPTNLHILDLETDILTAATSSEDMDIKNGPGDLAWAPDGRSVAIVAKGTFSEPRVRAASADSLLDEFYNLYEVPVGEQSN